MRKYSNKYKLMISTANAFLRTRARAAMSLLYRQVFGDFSSSTRGIGQVPSKVPSKVIISVTLLLLACFVSKALLRTYQKL